MDERSLWVMAQLFWCHCCCALPCHIFFSYRDVFLEGACNIVHISFVYFIFSFGGVELMDLCYSARLVRLPSSNDRVTQHEVGGWVEYNHPESC